MRLSTLSLPASVLALASLVLAEGDSDVVSLTTGNFDSWVSAEPLALVEFFAPWLVFTEATPGIHNLRLQ